MGVISQSLQDEKLQLNGSQGERKFEFIIISIDVYVMLTTPKKIILFCLFALILYVLVNNLSVTSGRVFLG